MSNERFIEILSSIKSLLVECRDDSAAVYEIDLALSQLNKDKEK